VLILPPIIHIHYNSLRPDVPSIHTSLWQSLQVHITSPPSTSLRFAELHLSIHHRDHLPTPSNDKHTRPSPIRERPPK
jgi:hypothetical protein